MRNNAAYLPESPIVYIILPKSIRNRASFSIFAEPIIFVTINKKQNRDRGSLPPVARFCVMLQSDWRYFLTGRGLFYFPFRTKIPADLFYYVRM